MKPKIRKPYLTEIPHEGKEITFQYPEFKGYYGDVAKAIDREGLKRPNSPETASLVYDAWKNPKGEYESKIINILKNNWLWEFTGNLYLPKSNEEVNNGVILEVNPKITKGKLDMNRESLIKRLQDNDGLVKFVPFGYKTGEQNLLKFAKNPYIVARYGKEGAEKIAAIASKYSKKPKLWSFDSVDEEKIRMSALDDDRGFSDRLLVFGSDWDGYGGGRAFGVEK